MKFENFFSNTRSLIKLAYPILIAQLIQNLMGFFDTIMAGRVSATDLAAVAVASSIWLPITLTIYGITMALASIIAQHSGANQYKKITQATYQTAWIMLSIAMILIVAFLLFIPIVKPYINLAPDLEKLLFDYLYYIIWGAPGFCLFIVLRNFAEGLSLTKPTMIISILGLILNIPLNYIFIYGELGAPAYGGAGCGIATAIVYWFMCIAMFLYIYFARQFQKYQLFNTIYAPNFTEIKYILGIGIPIALSLLFEVSLFSVVAIILAPLGADIVASHQIALNFSGLVFMVPLSISMAVTIKIGFALGQQKYALAKEIYRHSIVFSLLMATITAAITLIFREEIAKIYTTDMQVIELAAGLMFVAALFQLSDAIQVISAGALRGYKDTKSILIITFISYWLVGLTVGILLAVTDIIVEPLGAAGFWIGFISGLTTAAIFLAWRLNIIQKRIDIQTTKQSE